jgi:hypothetical protein
MLRKEDHQKFNTMVRAAENGDLVMIEAKDAKTGEYRAVIAIAEPQLDDGEFRFHPVGNLGGMDDYLPPDEMGIVRNGERIRNATA